MADEDSDRPASNRPLATGDVSKPVIVAIGASAGGVQVLQSFFSAIPDDTGAAFVVIVHLELQHRSELAAILAARTRMPVVQLEKQEKLSANRVYVAATEISTLFLDASLRIKRFTERVSDLFSITPSDEGRPITDFAHRLEYDDLIKDARKVLAHLAPIGREIRSREGGWYDVRLRPYRTVDNKIDGVVITFVEVSERHQIRQRLQESEQQVRLLKEELARRSGNTFKE